MLYLGLLILLPVFLYVWLKKIQDQAFVRKQDKYKRLGNKYDGLVKESLGLKKENFALEKIAQETTALYDITKDICKSMEADSLFSIFQENINKYIRLGDCKFIRYGDDLLKYKGYVSLPLTIQGETAGYLLASGIAEEDSDKFHILGHQFLLGIKRALLYKKIQELAITDSLTQVFSRRHFLERFMEETERSRRFNYKFSFLMADIDYFKKCNDQYGHLVGDVILKEVSNIIKESIRQIDFVGRYGGEEFAIVLPETDSAQAIVVAERIRKAIEKRHIRAYDEILKVTISIGVSTFPVDAADERLLLERSDKALYEAKVKGRNKVCVYG